MISIKENFLSEDLFAPLKEKIVDQQSIAFYYNKDVAHTDEAREDFYFTHIIYDNHKPNSDLFEKMIPILKKLKVKSLIRIKLNLYTRTDKIVEHDSHIDYPFKHKAFLLSLNTCDGFTKIKNKKYSSVENRGLFFDGNTVHNSSSCTNDKARFNINFNYF